MDLVNAVYARDKHCCIVCGRWVEDGNKPHHEWGGYGRKTDSIDKMVLLCYECHFQRHHGKNSAVVRERCRSYLNGCYNNEV